jgi:hypothetical protein
MTRKRYALIYGSLFWGCGTGIASLLTRAVFFGHPLDMVNIITTLIISPLIGYFYGDYAYLYYQEKRKQEKRKKN